MSDCLSSRPTIKRGFEPTGTPHEKEKAAPADSRQPFSNFLLTLDTVPTFCLSPALEILPGNEMNIHQLTLLKFYCWIINTPALINTLARRSLTIFISCPATF